MRVLAGALLAVLATGPDPTAAANLAVTLDAHPLAHSCAVAGTATIVAYDPSAPRVVTYRFVRSDGTVSRTGRLSLTGDGVVAQSVRDEWTPHGTKPWISLEITAPERIRSQRVAVTSPCPRRVAAATR